MIAVLITAPTGVAAQDDPPGRETPIPTVVDAQEAVAAALELPQRAERVEAAVEIVLAAGPAALHDFGARLRTALVRDAKAPADADRGRVHAMRELARKIALGFVERAVNSEMFYAGQYDDLRSLQPFVGEFFFDLVIDTPDWFHDNQRPWIVRALRDLYATKVAEDRLARLREIAEDEDFETEQLREVLVYALAQWGDREMVRERLTRVREAAQSSDAEDRHAAWKREADIHYMLRDYATAAAAHQRFLRGSEENHLPLTPEDYYNTACCLSLAGDHETAFAELDRAVDLMLSGSVDASQRLERKLFETDRDLVALRRLPRFAKLLERAFGSDPVKKGPVKKR